MAERDFYEKGTMFAREAAGGADFARINTAFDNLIASVNQRGKSQEDIDGAVEAIEEQRKMALRIFGMANTDYIKKGLRDNGIEENTDEAF
jgi:hypothetical protein